ncbi:MAG TPA: EAL domain-containing protein [Gallionellaceae bacterium]|nr:EAL domain-containing protein [Gallionellaceae bacterium]
MFDAIQFLYSRPDDSLLYAAAYRPSLIILSVAIAIIAAYAAMKVSSRMALAQAWRIRLLWIAIGALTMGLGTWAMHFIGMLSLNLPCGVYYDPLLTMLSMAPGILASGVALAISSRPGVRQPALLLGSALMGGGIGAMHYTGMAALRIEGIVRYDPTLFALSILVAICLSFVALRVKSSMSQTRSRADYLVALIMGAAVSAMHYTAMSAAYFVRGDVGDVPESALSPNNLALIISTLTALLTLLALALAALSRNREITYQLRQSEQRWSFALEGGGDGVWDIDMRTGEMLLSKAGKQMFGFSEDEIGNNIRAWESRVHPDDKARVLRDLREYLRGNTKHLSSEYRVLCKDNSWKWILSRGMAASRNEDGRVLRMIGTHTDINERKKAEEELRLAALVYQNSSEAMTVTDRHGIIVSVNPAFTALTGYSLEEVLGKSSKMINSGRDTRESYQDMWREINSIGHWQGEIWNRRKNGELYLEWLTINTIYNDDGSVHRYVALFSDITQKKESEELIWRQANFDTLTSLPNRRMFYDRLEQEVKKSHRSGLPMALMLLDLDRFKEVNDTLGHAQGDVLLVEAARRISECVRKSDTVARLGGDEFTIILSELEDINSAERIAQNIIDSLARPFQLQQEAVFVSASVGITLYPNDAHNIDALIKNADQAMYVSKNSGRGSFSYFTASLQEAAQNRMRLINDLRQAMSKKQFEVRYQPIVEMSTGHINKAEALLRWHHAERGMVSPIQFIPLAEDSGLIHEIGDWVFFEASAQLKYWRTHYEPRFQVSINKSPLQFRQTNEGGEDVWLDRLRALDLPGQSMVIEITEGVLLNAEEIVAGRLLHYRDAGMQVAIDDFGTGYSSLSYLKKFDIDYLKIDQSFVRNLDSDPDDMALCQAIIVMAHKLGLKVIAEGVETPRQRDLLAAYGCDFAQGFLYSEAVPAAEFEALLKAQQQ